MNNPEIKVWAIVDKYENEYIHKRTYKEIAPFLFDSLIQTAFRYYEWKLIRTTTRQWHWNYFRLRWEKDPWIV